MMGKLINNNSLTISLQFEIYMKFFITQLSNISQSATNISANYRNTANRFNDSEVITLTSTSLQP